MELKVIRRFAFALLLVPLILVISGCGEGLPQGVVAQVGAAFVTQEQYDLLEAAYQASGRVPDPQTQPKEYHVFQESLAQYLVMLEVLRQKAPNYGIAITESEVASRLSDIKEMFGGDQQRFDEALDKEKLTLEQFEESLRERMLIDEMKEVVVKDVTVTEAEVKAYYDSHKSDYTTPEVREVRHILISPFAKAAGGTETIIPTEGDWEDARREADKVRSEILNGTDFGAEARKVSDDEATKDDGGDLGDIIRGEMVPEFETAVFSLKKGELSRPVRTEYGYHLIQVTDITPEMQMPYEQVKEKIRSALLASRQTATWDDWLRRMEEELGVAYRSGLTPSKQAGTTSTMIPLTSTTVTTETPETGGTGGDTRATEPNAEDTGSS